MPVNRVIDLMTVGTVHAFWYPKCGEHNNTSLVPDTACLLDWAEPQLLRPVLLSALFLEGIPEELTERIQQT